MELFKTKKHEIKYVKSKKNDGEKKEKVGCGGDNRKRLNAREGKMRFSLFFFREIKNQYILRFL